MAYNEKVRPVDHMLDEHSEQGRPVAPPSRRGIGPRGANLATMKPAVWLALLVGLPLSGLMSWLATRNADLSRVWEAITHAELGALTAAVVVMGVVYVLQAIRWRGVVGLDRPSRTRYVELVVAGTACNNVLPGRLGDLLRARWIAVDADLPSGRGLAAVVLDRTFDVVALVLLLCVSLPMVVGETWIVRIGVGSSVLVAGILIARALSRGYTSSRVRERHSRSLVRQVLRDLLEGLAEPLGRRRIARAVALSIAAWCTWAVAAILVATSVGVSLGLLDAFFVAAIVNLGVAIPSSPGYVGTYQWLGVQSLGVLAVGREEALAFSILFHAVWYVPTTLVGLSILALRIDWKGFRHHRASPSAATESAPRVSLQG